jgi:hypothetical protein
MWIAAIALMVISIWAYVVVDKYVSEEIRIMNEIESG